MSAPRPDLTALEKGKELCGVRVLVVDDSQINLEVIGRVLSLHGAQATLLESGEDALKTLSLSREGFDLVLMDLQMPGLDGCETTKRIRKDLSRDELPVVALTAGATAAESKRAEEVGMNDLLIKPVDPNQLVRCILRHVGDGHRHALPKGSDAPDVPIARGESSGIQTVGSPGIEWPSLKGIRIEEARSRFSGDRGLFIRTLERVLQDADLLLAQIAESAQRKDTPAVKMLLHKFRGQAANVGAAQIALALTYLERAAEAGNFKVESLQPIAAAVTAIKTDLQSTAWARVGGSSQ